MILAERGRERERKWERGIEREGEGGREIERAGATCIGGGSPTHEYWWDSSASGLVDFLRLLVGGFAPPPAVDPNSLS